MYNTKLGTSSCCQCPTECYGETDTLEIIKEFRQLYEKKLHQIDIHGGGDALKMKLKVQQKWIEDLTEQTELMAKVVKELESEASERVQMLEEQLQKSAQYASEVMKRYQMYDFPFDSDKSFQRIDCLENDVKNLLEFIRRVRDDCEWSVNGLEFYNVCYCDLFGKNNENASCRCSEMNKSDGQGGGEEISRDNQEAIIEQLRAEIRHLRSMGNPIDTNKQLKRKDEEIEKLKASMLDMRTALTEEVAYKHDMISMLKKDIQQLEERCVQSDKQTAFKDDIIKELRKEIKQLKQLVNNYDPNTFSYVSRLNNMQQLLLREYNEKKLREKRLKNLKNEIDVKNKILANLYEVSKSLILKTYEFSVNTSHNKQTTDNYSANQGDSKIENNKNALNNVLMEIGNKIFKNNESSTTLNDSNSNCECTKDERDDVTLNNSSQLIRNKDEIIEIQNDTLKLIQIDLQEHKDKERLLKAELEKIQLECSQSTRRCQELEEMLTIAQERAENLQKAVDLYLNSVNVLEAAEEKSKLEIEQQKITINNLQEALVNVKHELDEMKEKNQLDILVHQQNINLFEANINNLEISKAKLYLELSDAIDYYKSLQDSTFELEVEHLNNLQDMTDLENYLYKYRMELKDEHYQCKCLKKDLKKVTGEKEYFEKALHYFKREMGVMSEQLVALQEILDVSNQTCREENEELIHAVEGLQDLNGRLKAQLNTTELKMHMESEKSRHTEARIDELQQIIDQKNADLLVHDQCICEMKNSIKQNADEKLELQQTVLKLNATLMQLEAVIEAYEKEEKAESNSFDVEKNQMKCNCRNRGVNCTCLDRYPLQETNPTVQSKICAKCELFNLENNKLNSQLIEYKSKLEIIIPKYEKVKADLDNLKEKYDNTKIVLEKVKIQQDEKDVANFQYLKDLNRNFQDLQQKLNDSQNYVTQLEKQTGDLKQQLLEETRRESNHEAQNRSYQEVLSEIKEALHEWNSSLIDSMNETDLLTGEYCKLRNSGDIYVSSRCECAIFKKIGTILKHKFEEMELHYNETEQQNKKLMKRLMQAEQQQEKLIETQQEYERFREELTEQLKSCQTEEKRLIEFIEYLRGEIAKNNKDNAEHILQQQELASTQEQIAVLKDEIKKMISQQVSLNSENDKLLNQINRLQANINILEDANTKLRNQLENNLMELKALKDNNTFLVQQKDDLTNEVQTLSTQCSCLEKTNRVLSDTAKNLEAELGLSKTNQETLCMESRAVISNVRTWLNEQKKINATTSFRRCQTCKKSPQSKNRAISTDPPKKQPYISNKGPYMLSKPSPFKHRSNAGSLDWTSSSGGTEDEDYDDDFISELEKLNKQIHCHNLSFKNELPEWLEFNE